MPKRKVRFEDCITQIDAEIYKRRNKWTFSAIAWMDFDDVAQILRIHICKKWDMWDQARPLLPWVNSIITHQISNLLRNNYSNFSKPCSKCSANEGANFCSIYGEQSSSCPLYARWEKTKKHAYNTKLPLPLENHYQEVYEIPFDTLDDSESIEKIHAYMIDNLKTIEKNVYIMLYIDHLSEEEVAKKMGYRTSEAGRKAGYKRIKQIKKVIVGIVKDAIYSGKIDL